MTQLDPKPVLQQKNQKAHTVTIDSRIDDPTETEATRYSGTSMSAQIPNINITLINFQSAKNKDIAILNILAEEDPDVLLGTETWLSDSDITTSFFPSNYNYYRSDRDGRGGGVIIGVKKNLKSYGLPKPVCAEETECVMCVVEINQNQKILFGSVYRPNQNTTQCFPDLNSWLNTYDGKNMEIIIGGDFNMPNVSWENGIPQTKKNEQNQDLMLMMDKFHLKQCVIEDTRITGESSSLLDLMFTNKPEKMYTKVVDGLSDHKIVSCTYLVESINKIKSKKIKIYNYSKASGDIMQFMEDRWLDFQFQADLRDVEENWEIYKKDLLTAVEKFVPYKLVSKKNIKPWITLDIKKMIKKKKKLARLAKNNQVCNYHTKMSILSENIKKSLEESKNKYLLKLTTKNSRQLWSYVNAHRKEITSVPAITVNDEIIQDNYEKANILNRTFEKSFTTQQDGNLPDFEYRTNEKSPPLNFTYDGVLDQILKMNVKKGGGSDNITPAMLRLTAPISAHYLQYIFQKSLENSIVPADWRSAIIKPIPKGGSRFKPENYRPISLTSVVSKLFEHIIISHMLKHLNKLDLLSRNQFGFRKGSSTELLLIKLTNYISKHIQSGGLIDLIALDFSKAFDKVTHLLLCHKLERYGFSMDIVRWFKAFLTGRTQRVEIDGVLSDEINVTSGVPQGSVCGPVLFIIYLNDIADNLESENVSFADDGTIYRAISNIEDQKILQEDLTKIQQWCQIWMMELNAQKTVYCQMSRSKNKQVKPFAYKINDQNLKEVKEIKILGVTLTNDLRWDPHIDKICAKANQALYLAARITGKCETEVKLTAYRSLVRPHMEYSAAVWDPFTSKQVDSIESVQRRAVRNILNNYSREVCVTSMRNTLGLKSLEIRRKIKRLGIFYNIYNNNSSLRRDDYIAKPDYLSRKDHKNKVKRITAGTKYFENSFFPRTIVEWNQLPESIVDQPTVKKFYHACKTYFENNTCNRH